MKKNKNIPAGWTQKPLGEVLGPVHFPRFKEILEKHDGEMFEVQKAFLAYLTPFKAEFEVRGYDIGFLSYSIPYHVIEQMKAEHQKSAAQTAEDVTNDIMSKKRGTWD